MRAYHGKTLALLLAGVLLITCGACGNPPAAAPTSTVSEVFTLGYNNFGQGAYPLDLNELEATYAVESLGMKNSVVNNQFTISNLVTGAQGQISSGVDGLLFCGFSDTVFPTISELCSNSQTPFVLTGLWPTGEDAGAEIKSNPYFAGGVVLTEYSTGVSIGEIALQDGQKTAVIIAAAIGDVAHDARVAGFTDTFTEGGGEILGVAHCSDPSEATQKSSDLLSAYPDVECIYGTGGDYSMGLLNAIQSMNWIDEISVYGTDIDPYVISEIRAGSVAAANGASAPYCAGFSAALLINYLDGHPVLDADGQPYVSENIKAITVTADNVDDFETYWINNHAFKAEEFQQLLYRNNPDVTWADFEEVIAGYSFESRVAALK